MISTLYIVTYVALACKQHAIQHIITSFNQINTKLYYSPSFPLAPDLPLSDQLQHVRELSETSDETVTLNKEVPFCW